MLLWLQKYSSQDDSFFLKLFFLRIVEVEGKELKAVGAEPLSDGCCSLCIHGWEIETHKLSILNSFNLQLSLSLSLSLSLLKITKLRA